MNPHLQKLQREIASSLSEFNADQLLWHPADKWCAAEILEHLYLTYTGTIKGFTRVLEANHPLAAKITWKNRGQSFIVIGLGYMPGGRISPPNARPRGVPGETVMAEIGSKVSAMDDVMSRCAAKFGAGTRMLDHPLLGPLSVNQWQKFHLVHGMHHVRQIRRLRDQWPAA